LSQLIGIMRDQRMRRREDVVLAEHYDDLETRDPIVREAALFDRLPIL